MRDYPLNFGVVSARWSTQPHTTTGPLLDPKSRGVRTLESLIIGEKYGKQIECFAHKHLKLWEITLKTGQHQELSGGGRTEGVYVTWRAGAPVMVRVPGHVSTTISCG